MQTLILVTAADSEDNVTSVSATAASAGVGVIAVGMTDQASEVNTIQSASFEMESFASIYELGRTKGLGFPS